MEHNVIWAANGLLWTQLYKWVPGYRQLWKCECLVVARNCCMARMLPGEVELVSEWTGLPGNAKSVKRFERSNGLDTALLYIKKNTFTFFLPFSSRQVHWHIFKMSTSCQVHWHFITTSTSCQIHWHFITTSTTRQVHWRFITTSKCRRHWAFPRAVALHGPLVFLFKWII